MTRQRNTRQREILLELLQQGGRPLAVQELHDAAKEQLETISLGTVYRSLKTFLEEGLIAEVEIPGHALRYERADLPHHHHVHCLTCDRVYDMDHCVGDVVKLAPKGFDVQTHYILLSGTCADCQDDSV